MLGIMTDHSYFLSAVPVAQFFGIMLVPRAPVAFEDYRGSDHARRRSREFGGAKLPRFVETLYQQKLIRLGNNGSNASR